MDVILLERVEKLGRIGDVVSVKPGFARNFLLPRGKALRATDANKAKFEAQRAHIEADNAKRREAAEATAGTMTDVSVVLIRQASNAGALYGSVSARDIAEALAEGGHKVLKSAVVLDKPIKTLGVSEVKLVLHPEVTVTAKVNVARSPEEAELQAKGVDVTADLFEREEAGFTEDYDPNAEPGATADEAAADVAEAEGEAEA
ncbi:50S ribosomal protein L9 [Sandaracinobacter sp. RS1-74]|uniref:50S ribosomal protein L9 n=1 Tax=Sandaracinobacteroides sayramensis TaxID=2913411 RepID=UPI001EDACCE4|nr:50S ribosomal protein L9 [Sandaracinobacteroides sayramensis]MCG2841706.1 50S ribosomal protein L9 [Sandaracinobacteroides sayramensis]